MADLVAAEAVPTLPVQRYTDTGQRKRAQWQDTFAFDIDGALYVTTNRLQVRCPCLCMCHQPSLAPLTPPNLPRPNHLNQSTKPCLH